jgi:hypothetical protein
MYDKDIIIHSRNDFADTVAGYIHGLLDSKKFRRTTYALDRASREAALTRLFEQSISSEGNETAERIAA